MASKKRKKSKKPGRTPKQKLDKPDKDPVGTDEDEEEDSPVEISLNLPKFSGAGAKLPLIGISLLCLLISGSKLLIDIDGNIGQRNEYQAGAFYTGTPYLLAVLFIALVFIITSFEKRRDLWIWGIPTLAFFTVLFSFYSNTYDFPAQIDFSYFSVMADFPAHVGFTFL